jgi:hypothetical protein
MRDFLFFDSMLTPKIITGVYWLGLVLVVLGSLSTLFMGDGGFMMRLVKAPLMLVLGAVGVRVWCELLIVMFKINENIKKMADKP